MSSTFLFAGASSKMALSTAALLKQQDHAVIGLSTKEPHVLYDTCYTVNAYESACFPKIDGAIDGLVYFPGTIQLKPFQRFTEQDFLNDFKINTLGAAAFIQAYLNNLKGNANASVVLISSVAASAGMPFHSSIAMAKGALEALCRSLSAELAPGIRVNCIAPSLTNTPLAEKFINSPEKLEASQKRNPLKKVGEASDIANLIEFLLSEKAAWITGQCIAIDGGMSTLKLS